MSQNRTKTEKIELVETDNLARSLKRLKGIDRAFYQPAIRRALYHSSAMSNAFDSEEMTALRIALKLP